MVIGEWNLKVSMSFLSVNQLSLQSGKVYSGKLEHIFPSINFSGEFSRIHVKETQKSFDSHQNKLLQTRSTTRDNLIFDFSNFEFPADFSTKETYEQCTGKLSVANSVDRRTETTLKTFIFFKKWSQLCCRRVRLFASHSDHFDFLFNKN